MTTPTAERKTISPSTAYLLAALAMVIYSSPPAVTRAVSAGVPPLALALSRWVIALVILQPFVWRKLPGEWAKLRQHWPSLVLLSAFMVAGSTMSVLAVYFTTATNAVLVNASQPAITAFLAWAIAGLTLTLRQRLGIVCAFCGIVVMIVRADLGVLLEFDVNAGDFIMLLAVLGWSTYAVKLGHRRYKPDPIVLMALIALVGTVALLPAYLIESAIVGPFSFSTELAGAMLYLSVFPTIIATLAWNAANLAVGPNKTAIFVNLIPVSGAVLAMLMLGERLFVYHLIGAAFVFCGIWLAVHRGS